MNSSVLIAALSALVGAASLTSPALGWGNTGHAQVAEIAWSRLDAQTRLDVAQLLKQHPRFAEDFEARMPASVTSDEDRDRWIFLQASIWPDVVRRYKKDDDPALRKLHRGTWHYINEPLLLSFLTGRPDLDSGKALPELEPVDRNLRYCRSRKDLNIAQAIKLSLCKLESTTVPPAQKALYMSWLIHLVGDAHQPLHAVSLYSTLAFRRGDAGGNGIHPEGVRSLHAAWDALPGRTGRSDRVTLSTAKGAQELLAKPKLTRAGRRAAKNLSVDAWVEESRDLARMYVYSGPILTAVRETEQRSSRKRTVKIPALDDAYLTRSGQVAQRQILKAGFRLAAMLETREPVGLASGQDVPVGKGDR